MVSLLIVTGVVYSFVSLMIFIESMQNYLCARNRYLNRPSKEAALEAQKEFRTMLFFPFNWPFYLVRHIINSITTEIKILIDVERHIATDDEQEAN